MAQSILDKLIVIIGADNSELDKALLESSRKIEKVGQRLERMGRSLSLNVTAPLAALGAITLRSSIRFEDAMAGVSKTVDASAERIAELGQRFTELSEEIPVAAAKLAGIGEAAGQLGIATDNILGFTRVMADLGVATNLSSEEAATSLARLANITGLPQDSFDRLGSTIVALGNNLATTEREIVEMALRLAGAGNQVGLTEAQILSLSGALSSVGIAAEAGGTAFSRVMAEMQKAVFEGGKKLDRFADIAGMTTESFAKLFKEDAAEAIVVFVEGLGRLSAAGENVFGILEDVEFGNIRVRDALLRAAGAGDLLRRSLKLGSEAWEENNALTEEAEKFYETTGNRLKVFLNKLQNVSREMGDQLVPAFESILSAARPTLEVIRDLVKVFADLPKGVRAAAIAFVALTAALGPLLVIVGRMIAVVGRLSAVITILRGTAALAGLAAVLGPAAPVLAGLAALSAAFLLLRGRAGSAAEAVASFDFGALNSEEVLRGLDDVKKKADELHEVIAANNRALAAGGLGRGQRGILELSTTRAREQLAVLLKSLQELVKQKDILDAASGPETVKTGGGGLVGGLVGDLDAQATLAKRALDRMVASTKTAVDDMELELERYRDEVFQAFGSISVVDPIVKADLNRMVEAIKSTRIGEAFAAEIEKLSATVKGLHDNLFAMDPAAVAAFQALEATRTKILETRDDAEEFKDELAEIEAILGRLKGKISVKFDGPGGVGGGGFLAGLFDQAKGIFDPKTIVSTALGGLLSGGLSTALSGLFSGIGGLFGGGGPSASQIAAAEALQRNTEAIARNVEAANRLADNLNAVGDASVALPFDQLLAALLEGQRLFNQQPDINRTGLNLPTLGQRLGEALERAGLSLDDVTTIAEALGIEFENLSRDAGSLITALQNLNTFNRDFGLLQKKFAFFDIENPADQFEDVIGLLADSVTDEFAKILRELTPENFDAFLEMFRAGFGEFDQSLLGDDLTFEQFLTALGFLESGLDSLADEVERATAAMRNVPAGFKIALGRFRATDPVKGIPANQQVTLFSGPTMAAVVATAVAESGLARGITIQGDVILQGVQDPDQFMRQLEKAVQRRARTGVSIISTRTRRT